MEIRVERQFKGASEQHSRNRKTIQVWSMLQKVCILLRSTELISTRCSQTFWNFSNVDSKPNIRWTTMPWSTATFISTNARCVAENSGGLIRWVYICEVTRLIALTHVDIAERVSATTLRYRYGINWFCYLKFIWINLHQIFADSWTNPYQR